MAVAVDVGQRHRGGIPAGTDRIWHRCGKISGAVTGEDENLVDDETCRNDVRMLVAVGIASRHHDQAASLRRERKTDRLVEAVRAVAQRNLHVMAQPVAGNQIRMTVAIEVGGGDRACVAAGMKMTRRRRQLRHRPRSGSHQRSSRMRRAQKGYRKTLGSRE